MASIGSVPLEAWLLFTANLVWTVAYDTMYAMVDRDDDLKIGLSQRQSCLPAMTDTSSFYSMPYLSRFLFIIGMSNHLGLPYWLGLVAAVGFLLYQQMLIHKRERDPCFKAFLNNHYVGLVIFIGLAASLPLPF